MSQEITLKYSCRRDCTGGDTTPFEAADLLEIEATGPTLLQALAALEAEMRKDTDRFGDFDLMDHCLDGMIKADEFILLLHEEQEYKAGDFYEPEHEWKITVTKWVHD